MVQGKIKVYIDGVEALVDRALVPKDEEGRDIEYLLSTMTDGLYDIDNTRYNEYLTDKVKKEKSELFEEKWRNLKLAYSLNDNEAYQIQYGYEINDSLDANTLYDIRDLNNIVEVPSEHYKFKLDRENINVLTAKKNAEYNIEYKQWYGGLGTYDISNAIIVALLIEADTIVQAYADDILGG